MPGVVLDAEDTAETKADRSPCLGAECILEREMSEQMSQQMSEVCALSDGDLCSGMNKAGKE